MRSSTGDRGTARPAGGEGTDRPLHVLLIHQLFVLGEEAGATRHYELARHLVRRGDRMSVVSGPVSYLTGRPHGAGRGSRRGAAVEGGIRLYRPWMRAPVRPSFAGRIAGFLMFSVTALAGALRMRDVDVVWGTSPPLIQAAAALAVARLKGVPFVLEVRDLWPEFAVELGVLRNPVLIRLSRWLERTLYRAADRIVVNSPGFIPHVQQAGMAREQIRVVPNGVELEAFSPDARAPGVRAELGLEGKFVALYAGAHGIPNHLEVLLEAAGILRAHPEIALVLVGDGREKERLVARARECELDNVHFVPAQPKTRIPEFLAAADVCIAILRPLPMFTTTYPNKVFDYMAAGRPTVLAIDGVIREVIEEGPAGRFVEPGNPAALAAAIREYAADPELCQRHGAAARALVARRFRRDHHAAALREILRQAVAG